MIAPSPRYHMDTMLGVSKKELFSRRIYMKIEVTSQRRDMLLFWTTKMVAVTSPANQKCNGSLFIISKNKSLRMLASFY